ncbi:hypothetical protein SDC9_145029 [bioreactor metagenome]|uniref:FAD-dependent protein C-terminal domain-containing protein n=1 Tax=bioreactor metagenome TaxID=1076179 RepID=A0A645E8W3_9ZZZZ
MLYNSGFDMISKPFSIGLRIEHLQSEIDRVRYGRFAGHRNLKAADYQLSHKDQGRTCYTFCMCPGGTVVAATSEEDGIVTNGMSDHAREGVNANSAVVVAVDERDFGKNPLDGMEFQRHYERQAFFLGGSSYAAPIQTVGSFLHGKKNAAASVKPSYTGEVTYCDLSITLPGFATELLKTSLAVFGRKIEGFDLPDAILTGVETRTSAPLRIIRNENLQAPAAKGLYPCGEGAGYAGGIMSAAIDGIKTALSLMETYTPD